MVSQEVVVAEDPLEAAMIRKSLRPVLILSRRNLSEHTTFIRHLLVGLADESIPVALICPPGQNIEALVPVPAAVFTHPAIALPLAEHLGVERLAGQLEKFRPTVLHCLGEDNARLARRLARSLELPYVLMVNAGVRCVHKLPISTHRCARIVVPADTIRAGVARALPRFADRIAQINLGAFVETDTICFTDPSRLPSLVVAHPLARGGDFAKFFRAIKSLRADGREFMVAIMGTGPAEHRIRKRLVALGLSDLVTIVPILDPWRSVVVAGDIFVQPQPLRSFSVFLLEAMAVGTAVAACRGGVDDLIVPNETAVLFEPDSEPSIRQALGQLLDEHDFARRLATTAQEHIRTRYSVSAMVSATLKVYQEAQQSYRQ
jgi:glycosyltransferase involved in cell wall biosynthesis